MSTFEDHLWSQLVSDHGEQVRQAGEATARLASSLRASTRREAVPTRSIRSSRRPLACGATAFVVLCCAIAIVVAGSAAPNPSSPATILAAFAITDNHDGTVTVTLRKRSALPVLNASLASYGLKAKLPGDASARTLLSLTATCPKEPKLPTKGHPLGFALAGTRHAPLPGTPHPLTYCDLHTN